MKIACSVLLLIGTTLGGAVVARGHDTAAPGAGEKLGTVSFSTSCRPAVETAFNRALAMFHSFWFDPAATAFADVAKADPSCGMAYWGIAMTRLGNPFGWPPAEKPLVAGAQAPPSSSANAPERECRGAILFGTRREDPRYAGVAARRSARFSSTVSLPVMARRTTSSTTPRQASSAGAIASGPCAAIPVARRSPSPPASPPCGRSGRRTRGSRRNGPLPRAAGRMRPSPGRGGRTRRASAVAGRPRPRRHAPTRPRGARARESAS
jgi:hypothetical protein